MLGKMLGFGRNENYDKAIRLFDQGLYEEAIEGFSRPEPAGKRDALTERLARFYTAEAHANLGHIRDAHHLNELWRPSVAEQNHKVVVRCERCDRGDASADTQ